MRMTFLGKGCFLTPSIQCGRAHALSTGSLSWEFLKRLTALRAPSVTHAP